MEGIHTYLGMSPVSRESDMTKSRHWYPQITHNVYFLCRGTVSTISYKSDILYHIHDKDKVNRCMYILRYLCQTK